jgi:nucleoside-diphosphate-sugar epimerase/glycosyltransferase involved in cell wall biosynthesis
MRVIAVTGAGGMIGRHLVDALRPTGAKLRALLLPDETVPSSFEGVEIERGDIRRQDDLCRLMQGVDTVFHLAALVGRDANRAEMDLARAVNVGGTCNVIEAAKQQKVSRLVFLSTCCVYGLYGSGDEILDESSPPRPQSLPYDLSKTEAEQLVMSEDPAKLGWSILEIPVALGGEHTTDKPTILSMLRFARLRLVPVPISGITWVNYVFGRDVADALVLLARHPDAVGRKFIFSESRPLAEFISLIGGSIGRRSIALPVPRFALDFTARWIPDAVALTNRRRFSSEKIRSLGFIPSVGLERGLERTLRHYQKVGLLRDCALKHSGIVAAGSAVAASGLSPVPSASDTEKASRGLDAPIRGPLRRLRVIVLTPGVNGMGGISRMMDWVAEEIGRRPSAEVDLIQVSTRGDKLYLRPFLFLSSIARVASACVLRRCDLLHVNLASQGSTYRKLVLAGIARLTGTPYVVHLHGGSYREFWAGLPSRVASLVDDLFCNARRVVVLGSSWASLVSGRVPEARSRITVLPNAVPRPSRAVDRTVDRSPLTVVFIGRLNAAKGVPELVEALSRIRSLGGWNAVLAGDGEVERTREAIRVAGLADRVSVPGWLDPGEVDALWQRAGILVLPSFIENLPLSIIEAFSYGVPVISTPVGSISELVDHGRTGLLVPAGDVDALVAALRRLVEDPGLCAKLAAEGRAEYAARFELAGYVDRLVKIWIDAARLPSVDAASPSSRGIGAHR